MNSKEIKKKLKKRSQTCEVDLYLINEEWKKYLCSSAQYFDLPRTRVKNCPPVRRRPLEPGSGMGRNCAEYKIILKFICNYYIIVPECINNFFLSLIINFGKLFSLWMCSQIVFASCSQAPWPFCSHFYANMSAPEMFACSQIICDFRHAWHIL